MKPYFNAKKVILTLILLLFCCDVSLLFAADQITSNQNQPSSNSLAASQPTATGADQSEQLQLQQLQQVANGQSDSSQVTPQNQSPSNSVAIQQSPAPLSGPVINPAPVANAPQAANTQPNPDQALSETAFANMARTTLPMSPEQITRLRQLFNTTQYAAISNGTPSKPVIRSQFVNLAPGTVPPPIRLRQGVVTTLAFIDSTGQPWPIDAYDIGDPGVFNVQWNKTDNILFVQPTKQYFEDRNLVVRLRGLATPVTLTLLPPQLSDNNAVDYRVDLHLSGYGPNASPIATNELPNSANPDLLAVLSGIPPAGAKELTVAGGGDSQIWLVNDKLFVRTRLTIVSPGWLATMSSADGMKAYEMQKTPMILVSQNGKAVHLKVEGL